MGSLQFFVDRVVFFQIFYDINKILMEIKLSMDDFVVCVDFKVEVDFKLKNFEQRILNVKVNFEVSVDSDGKN